MSFDLNLLISDEVKEIQVSTSTSFNYQKSKASADLKYTPDKAHDGDFDTWYSVKDGAVAGNFLKLYLGGSYKIEYVKVTCRGGNKDFLSRLENTEVRVSLSTGGVETSVASCGEIHGRYSNESYFYINVLLHFYLNLHENVYHYLLNSDILIKCYT